MGSDTLVFLQMLELNTPTRLSSPCSSGFLRTLQYRFSSNTLGPRLNFSVTGIYLMEITYHAALLRHVQAGAVLAEIYHLPAATLLPTGTMLAALAALTLALVK